MVHFLITLEDKCFSVITSGVTNKFFAIKMFHLSNTTNFFLHKILGKFKFSYTLTLYDFKSKINPLS